MPGKIDPTQTYTIRIRAIGGTAPSNAVIAPKFGAYGMAPKMVGDSIIKATKEWAGIGVTCDVQIFNRQLTTIVVPNATSLILRELKEPLRDRKVTKHIKHDGNITKDQLMSVARAMRHRSCAVEMKGTVKEMLGTCRALGCTVDGEAPQDIVDEINEGAWIIPDQ